MINRALGTPRSSITDELAGPSSFRGSQTGAERSDLYSRPLEGDIAFRGRQHDFPPAILLRSTGRQSSRHVMVAVGWRRRRQRAGLREVVLAMIAILTLSNDVLAEAWKKIEAADSALIVAIPALKDAKPTYFDRAEDVEIGGSPSAKVTVDKAGYASSGHLGVFWYESFVGPVVWRSEGLRAVVEALDWIADKSLTMSRDEKPYFRGNAEGSFRTLTYRPQTVDRPCVAAQYARSGTQISERVTMVVCQPVGTTMDLTAARKLVDGVGTKALPPVL